MYIISPLCLSIYLSVYLSTYLSIYQSFYVSGSKDSLSLGPLTATSAMRSHKHKGLLDTWLGSYKDEIGGSLGCFNGALCMGIWI